MGIEGQLTIDLYRNGNGSCRAEIASTRPVDIARLFHGKTASETLATVPLLFSICAKAQAAASVAAQVLASLPASRSVLEPCAGGRAAITTIPALRVRTSYGTREHSATGASSTGGDKTSGSFHGCSA